MKLPYHTIPWPATMVENRRPVNNTTPPLLDIYNSVCFSGGQSTLGWYKPWQTIMRSKGRCLKRQLRNLPAERRVHTLEDLKLLLESAINKSKFLQRWTNLTLHQSVDIVSLRTSDRFIEWGMKVCLQCWVIMNNFKKVSREISQPSSSY